MPEVHVPKLGEHGGGKSIGGMSYLEPRLLTLYDDALQKIDKALPD